MAMFLFASVALPFLPTEEIVPTIPLPEAGIEFQITAEQENALEELNLKNNNKFQVKWPETKRNNFYMIYSMPDGELGEVKKVGKKFLKKVGPIFRLKPQFEDLYLENVVRVDPPNVEKIAKEKFGKTLGELLHMLLKSNRGNNALRFINKYLDLNLGDIISELRKGTTHLTFQQTHNDIPIYGAKVLVHIPDGKKPSYVNGTYYPDVEVSNEVNLSEEEAIIIAKESLNISIEGGIIIEGEIIANLVILPVQGDFYYAYEILFSTIEPLGDWEIIVNAQGGEVHGLRNLVLFLVTGTGLVYENHPLISNLSAVYLPNLNDPGSSLNGLFARVFNADGAEAYKLNSAFGYLPDNTHFDEVMAYYHVDKAHSYFRDRTGLTTMDWDINATVHAGSCWDNAHYRPAFTDIRFGDGSRGCGEPDGLNDLAKEESIIYHEYTHAVRDSIFTGRFSSAINEGMADYYAASFTDDSIVGEYVAEGLVGRSLPRDLDNDRSYVEDVYRECHWDGMIYGGGLWDYRNAFVLSWVPEIVADSTILNGILNITPNLSGSGQCSGYTDVQLKNMFIDGLNGLVVASKNGQWPVYTNRLLDAFAKHGVFQENFVAIIKSIFYTVPKDFALNPLAFEIWTGDAETSFNDHYYVQLATDRSLFLEGNAGLRNNTNFYQSSLEVETDDGYATYAINKSVFQNFVNANSGNFPIFYRVITYTAGPLPSHTRVSTPDTEYTIAPFITVTSPANGCACSEIGGNYSYPIKDWWSSSLIFIIPAIFILSLKFFVRRRHLL